MLKLTTGKHITEDIQRAMDIQCPEAYSRLMDENIDMVRRVVYRIVLNEHDTDDVVQEAFVKAFQKMKSFKGVAKFSSWLCRIAYNEAYMFLRKKDDKQVVGDQLHVLPARIACGLTQRLKRRRHMKR